MRRFLWLLTAALVLVGAFLLPGLLMKTSIMRIENTAYTSDASGTWQGNGTAIPMGEKLNLLLNTTAAIQETYDFGVVAAEEELREKYFAELQMMVDNGILGAEIRDMLQTGGLTIYKTVLLDMERGELLSLYKILYDDETLVVLDAQSGKILLMILTNRERKNEQKIGILAEWHEEHRPNWAGYYGAENAESYSVQDFQTDLFAGESCLYAQRFTLDGATLGFTVFYDEYRQTITWKPDTADVVNWLISAPGRDAALEDEIG